MAVQLQPRGAFRCCGVRVDAVTLDDAVDRLRAFTETGGGRAVHLCNAWTLALAGRDGALNEALNRGDLHLPDGAPLTWVGRRVGFTYCGASTAPTCCSPPPGPVALGAAALPVRLHPGCGRRPHQAAGRRRRRHSRSSGSSRRRSGRSLSARRPNWSSGSVGPRPDVVWVGLGTPLQDLFVDRFPDRLGTTLVAVGAAFDFIGAKHQAPTWMQDRGLEWAFRLATEPSRLWRRYFVGNTMFVAGVVRGIEVCSSTRRSLY